MTARAANSTPTATAAVPSRPPPMFPAPVVDSPSTAMGMGDLLPAASCSSVGIEPFGVGQSWLPEQRLSWTRSAAVCRHDEIDLTEEKDPIDRRVLVEILGPTVDNDGGGQGGALPHLEDLHYGGSVAIAAIDDTSDEGNLGLSKAFLGRERRPALGVRGSRRCHYDGRNEGECDEHTVAHTVLSAPLEGPSSFPCRPRLRPSSTSPALPGQSTVPQSRGEIRRDWPRRRPRRQNGPGRPLHGAGPAPLRSQAQPIRWTARGPRRPRRSLRAARALLQDPVGRTCPRREGGVPRLRRRMAQGRSRSPI